MARNILRVNTTEQWIGVVRMVVVEFVLSCPTFVRPSCFYCNTMPCEMMIVSENYFYAVFKLARDKNYLQVNYMF